MYFLAPIRPERTINVSEEKIHPKFERVTHNASKKIILRSMFGFSHKENCEAGHTLLFFIPHMQYFEEGVGLCPRARTACLCLSLQGQQTLFLNAVIGNSIIQ